MNAERFLAYYQQVADAPDAIARLRRFVLELAIRGKLVSQNPADEPASELLKRIAVEKARLVKAGEIRKPKMFPAVDQPPFDLPENWRWTRIREATSDRCQEVPQASFTYIDVTAIDKDAGVISDPKILGANEAPSRARKTTQKGDVIYSCVRPYLLNVAVIETDFDPPPIASTAFAILNGHGLVVPRYIWIVLRSPFMVECVETNQRGQAYPAINDADFAVLPFPLPPLAEQRRIVAKVDELMGLCDRLEEARADRETVRDRLAVASLARLNGSETAVPTAAASPEPQARHAFADHARFVLDALPALTARPDQIRGLRQTILSLAVRGKLVPQNAKDEPASKLLDRIAKDKAARAVSARDRRAAKIRPLLDTEAPFPLPANWLWASFGDITISRDSERIPVSREERAQKSKIYDYYGASGIIDKIDGYLFDKPLLLIGEDGANLINRSTPIAFIARGEYWVNNHAHVLDGLSESFLQYLDLFINATDLKPYVTGTAQPKMNQAKMNSIPVALPPLAEQTRIVAKVDALMALCDNLEASLTVADDTRRRLLDALLAEALAPDEDRLLEAAE
ncbi:Restriction endonuclease subunit S [Methylorubrum thiocyanatum]